MIGMKENKKKNVAGSLVNYNTMKKNPQLRTIALIYMLYINVSDHKNYFFLSTFLLNY